MAPTRAPHPTLLEQASLHIPTKVDGRMRWLRMTVARCHTAVQQRVPSTSKRLCHTWPCALAHSSVLSGHRLRKGRHPCLQGPHQDTNDSLRGLRSRKVWVVRKWGDDSPVKGFNHPTNGKDSDNCLEKTGRWPCTHVIPMAYGSLGPWEQRTVEARTGTCVYTS